MTLALAGHEGSAPAVACRDRGVGASGDTRAARRDVDVFRGLRGGREGGGWCAGDDSEAFGVGGGCSVCAGGGVNDTFATGGDNGAFGGSGGDGAGLGGTTRDLSEAFGVGGVCDIGLAGDESGACGAGDVCGA